MEDISTSFDWTLFFTIILIIMIVGLVLAIGFLIWVISRVRRIDLPPDADFMTALRLTPLSVVILLDLLDLSLDFLSAPFAWIILGYLGLYPLRAVTTVEAFIPGTQALPTMTAAWIVARLTDPRRGRQGLPELVKKDIPPF